MPNPDTCPKQGEAFFCSWSGGKDSCLALYKGRANGGLPACLVTMLVENGRRTRSHGLAVEVVQQQASSLGIRLASVATSWADYEANFIGLLKQLRTQNIHSGVFGDIDIDDHRAWEEKVCAAARLKAYLPLWKSKRRALLDEFLQLGFRATIVATQASALAPEFLGRQLNQSLVDELVEQGIDPSGENGEYHTVVTDGPLFAYPLELTPRESLLREGYWFLDLEIKSG